MNTGHLLRDQQMAFTPPNNIQRKKTMTNQTPQNETSNTEAALPIPEDFPRDPFPAALSGSQLKFAARLIDGRYVVGLTEQERRERYEVCLDLVEQMKAYTDKKHLQLPDLSMEQLLDQIDRSIRLKDWGLSSVEFDWIMKELRARFG